MGEKGKNWTGREGGELEWERRDRAGVGEKGNWREGEELNCERRGRAGVGENGRN